MITRYTHDRVTWVDLTAPTESDIEEVAKEFELDSTISADLRIPTGRTKIEKYSDYIYLVMHFPGSGSATAPHQELDVVLGKNFILTSHYENINAVHEFSKLFESHAIRGHHANKLHAGYIFHSLILHIYRTLEQRVDYLREDIENTEQGIFGGRERSMVEELSSLSRRVLNFRLAIKPHSDLWKTFAPAAESIFDESYSRLATGIQAAHLKIWHLLEGEREALTALRETNDSLLTAKTNETLVHLSMMAFVVFPLTLIASLFGMNSLNLPIIGHPQDFWIILGLMFCAVILMFGFFKYRRWL